MKRWVFDIEGQEVVAHAFAYDTAAVRAVDAFLRDPRRSSRAERVERAKVLGTPGGALTLRLKSVEREKRA